jgi:GntR family transcriptional regulator
MHVAEYKIRGVLQNMTQKKHTLYPLDGNNKQPLYLQVQQTLRRSVDSGTYQTHEALPPERQIADELGVSRITVRKAIEGLIQEGLLFSRQGSGTFVRPRIEKNFAKISSFSEDMRARGRVPSSAWIAKTQGLVSPDEALALNLSPGTPVFRFHRLRYADNQPMLVEYATIVAEYLPSLDFVENSLYDALGDSGHRPVRALQRLRALLLDEKKAKLLHAKAGDAGLLVERIGFLRDGRAVEFCQSYFRGDTYDFIAELSDL